MKIYGKFYAIYSSLDQDDEEELQLDHDDHCYDTYCPKYPLILNFLPNQLILHHDALPIILHFLTTHHHLNTHSAIHYTIIFIITTTTTNIIEFIIPQKLLNFLIVHHQQHYLKLLHFIKEVSYNYSSLFKQQSYLDWLLFSDSLYFNWTD